MSETGAATPAVDLECTDLLAQAEGMERKDVMKKVVGPFLSDFLMPVFSDPITAEELIGLEDFHNMDGFGKFAYRLLSIATGRARECLELDSDARIDLRDLIGMRTDLFYFRDPSGVLREGAETGVTTPLSLAFQVHVVEKVKAIRDFERNQKGIMVAFGDEFNGHVTQQHLLDILKRPFMDSVLLKLCKGPNAYLGGYSSTPHFSHEEFFNFYDERTEVALRLQDAFGLEDGQVTGMSDIFEVSADAHRRRLIKRAISEEENGCDQVRSSTSGCPVRHSFEDAHGNLQEPLVIVAKDFVVRALEAVNG